jgi:hypothetical protein
MYRTLMFISAAAFGQDTTQFLITTGAPMLAHPISTPTLIVR